MRICSDCCRETIPSQNQEPSKSPCFQTIPSINVSTLIKLDKYRIGRSGRLNVKNKASISKKPRNIYIYIYIQLEPNIKANFIYFFKNNTYTLLLFVSHVQHALSAYTCMHDSMTCINMISSMHACMT